MSPAKGGTSDKFGNRYEGAWTIRQLLFILMGRVDSITIEDHGEIGEGVEFTLQRGVNTEVHQVKRQHGTDNEWALHMLRANGVLGHAKRHVSAQREFWFVSIVPARLLHELSDRARSTPDKGTFTEHMLTSKDLRSGFSYLSKTTVLDSEQTAWETLRGLNVDWTGERVLRDSNIALAGLLLEGSTAELATLGLGDIATQHIGIPLDAATLESFLDQFGLRRARYTAQPDFLESVQASLDSWEASVGAELLRPPIPRSETEEITALLEGEARTLFVLGSAGSGKSAVLHEVVNHMKDRDWEILAFRLDRLKDSPTTTELGHCIGLPVSPVSALAGKAGARPCLLVIDQLDAVSLISGRMPTTLDTVAALVREASAFPNMRVLMACRKYDADNDHRIRSMATDEDTARIEVAQLNSDQADSMLRDMEVTPQHLSAQQRELLRLPLNLVLLSRIADQAGALAFSTTKDLFDAYWERKLADCRRRHQPAPRFGQVIRVLAEAMSARQRLSAPVYALDGDDLLDDANVLVSEHVLSRDGQQLAFFHEAFFDYAFARGWTVRGETLVAFLLSGEQDLFRRTQVRQILTHMREEDPARFVAEVEALLSHPEVRFHIKYVVLTFLRALPFPSADEWRAVSRLLTSQPSLSQRLWQAICTHAWFARADEEGALERWLASGDSELEVGAINLIAAGTQQHAARGAELLALNRHHPDYGEWLRWVVRYPHLPTCRPLFDLVLEAVRNGHYSSHEHQLWMSALQLGDHQPSWGVELLLAYLKQRPEALDLDGNGRMNSLTSRDRSVIQLTTLVADKGPVEFCTAIIPYMLEVMQLTGGESDVLPVPTKHFTYRYKGSDPHELADALLGGAAEALRKAVRQGTEALQPVLQQLAESPYEPAQWLLYQAIGQSGAPHADWAAELLLQGSHRFLSGYVDNSVWAARQVLQAISPHISADNFTKLEVSLVELRFQWERGPASGKYAFSLLSAMDESRLSEYGQRRLREFRRKFSVDQPPEPEGITGGFVQSPIPRDAVARMSDGNWLRAIQKYDATRTAAWGEGGAAELSGVLKTETAADPDRFARLALRLTAEHNPVYGDAILMGLADGGASVELSATFDALRHIASLGHDANDRWLAWALRQHLDSDIPDDIIQIILDRALHATDPIEDNWSRRGPGGEPYYGGDIDTDGMNTARGQSAEMLGELLVHDADGNRTALVAPSLTRLAEDPSVAVRSCVAHLLGASLRHARAEAVEAYAKLIDADDRLLGTRHVQSFIVYITRSEPELVEATTRRMLRSGFEEVRIVGGRLAAFAGLETGVTELMVNSLESGDRATRQGVAEVCAHRLRATASAGLAAEALVKLVTDEEEVVRKAAAEVAGALRGERLEPFEGVINALIDSPAFEESSAQLFITLEHAPDHVDELLLRCAERFMDLHASEAGDITKAAAADAQSVGELVLRAYAQAPSPISRKRSLDLIDKLLASGAFGIAEIVGEAER